MQSPFLTARWSNLAIITYDVDPNLLNDYLPPNCTLDTIDGRAFVSLVAFDFLDTRVLDVAWPGFVNFPEINLRFYVRGPSAQSSDRRGVSFIRELVPQRSVAWIARSIYNEPYFAVPMTSSINISRGRITTTHVAHFAARSNTIRVSGSTDTTRPGDTSREHFFKEHPWGYGTSRDRRLITYEVRHPIWSVYRDPWIDSLDWDFAAIYGPKWGFLGNADPYSLVFAVGSEVAVFPMT
ncbi:MAG: DUF2071 domain-containing protein [Anaerolineae bacterium]|nr:DUF2071 domain-containing protein [Phycisphaerae bacterium]